MVNFDISFGFVVSQEMMLDVYVLSFWVAYGIIGELYGTFIVTQEWDFGELTSEIMKGLPHPK